MVSWSSQRNLTRLKIPDLHKLFILLGLVIDGILCPGLRELLQRMVVPHIAGGAGVVGYGGWVTGVAWGRTFGEWMGIVIKNDVLAGICL